MRSISSHGASLLHRPRSVSHVVRVIRMIQRRWNLPILFGLYADSSICTWQLNRDLPGVTQKVLTALLRELGGEALIERIDFNEMPLRVKYHRSETGRQLLPVLIAAPKFSGSQPGEVFNSICRGQITLKGYR